jgi:GTPase SAR1 family protein
VVKEELKIDHNRLEKKEETKIEQKNAKIEETISYLPDLKVLLVGDSMSGKTSLMRRFIENKFDDDYEVNKIIF